MKSHRHGIESLLLRLLVSFFASLPERTSLRCGRTLGIIIYHILGKRRDIAFQNMHLCQIGNDLSDRKKILRRCMENFGMTAAEFLRQKIYSEEQYGKKVVIRDFVPIEKSFGKGRGVFLLSGHYDNWELLIQGVAALGYKNSMLVRQQHNLNVDDLINSLRKNNNVDVIIAETSPRNILRALKNRRGVATLLDIWGGKDGHMAEFFGHKISTPAGVLEIAVRQKVPILIGFLERLKDGRHQVESYEVIIPGEDEEYLDLNAVIEHYHRLLEDAIRKRPFFWLWTHKRFKNIIDYK
jgi:KDO2-lipid IV(A) lauroyltransferase